MLRKCFIGISLLGIYFCLSNPVFAEKKELESMTIDGQKYTRYTENKNGIDYYFIESKNGNEEELWQSQEDQNLNAFKACKNIMNKADGFATETSQKYDSKKWTRVILKRTKDTDSFWSNTCVDCYAKKDAVIHITCQADDYTVGRTTNYIYIKDPSMVDSFVGDKVHGLESEKFFKKYGGAKGFDRFHQVVFSFTLNDAETAMSIIFHFKNNKLEGISGDLQGGFDNFSYYNDFKQFVSDKIPEGLLTRGVCLSDDVKVLETPEKNIVKGNMDEDDPIYICEFKQLPNNCKWVKIITPNGIQGWVDAKNIAPEAHCFSAFSRIAATFDYLSQIKQRLGNPLEITIEEFTGSLNNKTKKWDGIELSEIFEKDFQEEEEIEEEVEEEDSDESEEDIDSEDENIEDNEDIEIANNNDEKNSVKKIEIEQDNNQEAIALLKLRFTKPVVDFIGFKVGSNLDELKSFSSKLIEAGWAKSDDKALSSNGTYTWYDNTGIYTRGIRVFMKNGKSTAFELLGPELAD